MDPSFYFQSFLKNCNHYLDYSSVYYLIIIDHYEEEAELVITDPGELECWACGMFNKTIYDNPKYEQ